MTKEKAIGLFKLRLTGILKVFNAYGMDVYIPPAIEAIVDISLEFAKDLKEADDGE